MKLAKAGHYHAKFAKGEDGAWMEQQGDLGQETELAADGRL